MFIWQFFTGLCLGALIGVALMCCLILAGRADEQTEQFLTENSKPKTENYVS